MTENNDKHVINDFFFNKISNKSMDLLSFKALSESVSNLYFQKQVDRLLTEIGHELNITISTSAIQFREFLNVLNTSDIGKIVISTVPTVNEFTKNLFVASIWLETGVIHLRTSCNVVEPKYRTQLINSLIVPLFINDLEKRTKFRKDTVSGSTFIPLITVNDFQGVVRNVLGLADQRISSDEIVELSNDLKYAIEQIKSNTKIREEAREKSNK